MNRSVTAAIFVALFLFTATTASAQTPEALVAPATATAPACPAPAGVICYAPQVQPQVIDVDTSGLFERLLRHEEDRDAAKAKLAQAGARARAEDGARVVESREMTKRVEAREKTRQEAIKARKESKETDTRAVFDIPQADAEPQPPTPSTSSDVVVYRSGANATPACRNKSLYRSTNKNGATLYEECRDWMIPPPPAPPPPPPPQELTPLWRNVFRGVGAGAIVLGSVVLGVAAARGELKDITTPTLTGGGFIAGGTAVLVAF